MKLTQTVAIPTLNRSFGPGQEEDFQAAVKQYNAAKDLPATAKIDLKALEESGAIESGKAPE